VNRDVVRVLTFSAGEDTYPVAAIREGGAWALRVGDGAFIGLAEYDLDGALRVSLDGIRQKAWAHLDAHLLTLRLSGVTWRLTQIDQLGAGEEDEAAADRLTAPIPGQVTQVAVTPGDAVTRGQVLVVLEAMKTVFRLTAPANKTVQSVACTVGGMVQEGEILVTFSDANVGDQATPVPETLPGPDV
jgi:3-methylcrotonyl-CoA carboxylase alpha subunit